MKFVLYSFLLILVSLLFSFEYGEPKTVEKLGEKLFFDKRLSKDKTISCASCHSPDYAFADTLNFSKGVNGALSFRNAPSVMNMASRSIFFYDGRATSLEEQVHFPIEDPKEMAFDLKKVAKRLSKDKEYKDWFKEIFNESPNPQNISKAIAEYERSLESSSSRFDNFMMGRTPSMTEAEIRGRALFMGTKAKCFDCHFTPDFTADEFKNIGLYNETQFTDKGRYDVTKKQEDLGKFKVPGLRNVALTAPYMHNGMFHTLEEVVEYYDNPFEFVSKPINIDTLLQKPLNLTKEEKSDIVAFLKALTDINLEHKIKK